MHRKIPDTATQMGKHACGMLRHIPRGGGPEIVCGCKAPQGSTDRPQGVITGAGLAHCVYEQHMDALIHKGALAGLILGRGGLYACCNAAQCAACS